MASANLKLMAEERFIRDALRAGRARVEEVSMKGLGQPDIRFQARVQHIDMDHVHRLSQAHDLTGEIAPVVIFRDMEGGMTLADGFHRHEMLRRKKMSSINAYVIDCENEDERQHQARLYAAMCNQVLSLARSRQDVRKAAEMLFGDPDCWRWSDERIALHIGSTYPTVRSYRVQFAEREGAEIPDVVYSKTGVASPYRTIKTEKRRDRKGTPRSLWSIKSLISVLRYNRIECQMICAGPLEGVICRFGSEDRGLIVAPVAHLNYSTAAMCVGTLILLKAKVGRSYNAALMHYGGFRNEELTHLAAKAGVKFLTEEELILTLKQAQASHKESHP